MNALGPFLRVDGRPAAVLQLPSSGEEAILGAVQLVWSEEFSLLWYVAAPPEHDDLDWIEARYRSGEMPKAIALLAAGRALHRRARRVQRKPITCWLIVTPPGRGPGELMQLVKELRGLLGAELLGPEAVRQLEKYQLFGSW